MVTSHATTTPTAVMAGIRAGSVPCSRTNRLAMPAHRTRKYDPGGPTRSARHRPALTIANSTAAQAKAKVDGGEGTEARRRHQPESDPGDGDRSSAQGRAEA